MDKELWFRVSLSVTGAAVDPEAISQVSGATPQEAHRQGDRMAPELPNTYSSGRWLLCSELDGERSLERHVDQLIKQIKCEAAVFKSACRDQVVQLICTVRPDTASIELKLRSDQLQWLGEVGAQLVMVFYGDDAASAEATQDLEDFFGAMNDAANLHRSV